MLLAWHACWVACANCAITRGYDPRSILPQPEINARDVASGASVSNDVQVQVLSWALQMAKGLTANCRESFFVGEAVHRPLGGKLGGRIGFTLDLNRLPFGRECRAEVESWRGWKKRDNGSSWSFG